MSKPIPTSVSRANRHDVLIDWNDGHRSLYPARDLRLGCSCAACIEEMTGNKILDAGSVPLDVHPLGINPVGRYALHFDWSDGHTSGIYTFDHLRSLCRCSKCKPDDSDPVNPPSQETPSMAETSATVTPNSTMQDILAVYPSAQQALFTRYHVGGCSSCGFQPTDTLEQVCKNNNLLNVDEVMEHIRASDQVNKKLSISPPELKTLMSNGQKLHLLDVRTPQELEQARIESAVPVTDELSQEIMKDWPKDSPIVLLCHVGERSLQAASFLAGHGFTNVKSLQGGIDAWSQEVDSTVPRYSAAGACKS